jgi:hypothetical protein
MQFTSAHLEDLLAANWPVAARLVAWARALAGLAAATLPKCVLVEARAILRPAESFIRRLIVIMACRLPVPQVRPSPARPVRPQTDREHTSGTQALRPLGPTESLAVRVSSGGGYTGTFAYPGLWAPGLVRYQPPTPEQLARAPVPAAHFFARLARLEAVLAAPEAAALRLARWLARHKSFRRLPVRPWGMMPGRNAGILDALTRDRLRYTAWAAQAALCDGAWNSS